MKCWKYIFVICAFVVVVGSNTYAADANVSGLATTKYVDGAIGALTDVLNGKQDKKIVKESTITTGENAGTFTDDELNDTDQYPSMKAAKQIADQITGKAFAGLNADVSAMQADIGGINEDIEGLQQTAAELGDLSKLNLVDEKHIENDAVTTNKIKNGNVTKAKLDSSVQASLGKADTALQGVTGGAAVAGKVATAVVKDGTNVSVTMGYVKIPVGSATAPTSVAEIWVQ